MKEIQNTIYKFINNEETQLEVKFDGENIWLSEKQLGLLFNISKSEIVKNIKSIYKTKELFKDFTSTIFTEREKKRIYINQYYNLDMVIALGLRINIQKLTEFKQWAMRLTERAEVINAQINGQPFYM